MSRHRPQRNLQGRRKPKKPSAPAAPTPAPEVLDLTIGNLRVRCAAAVALDPKGALGDEDEKLEPGDLLIEERSAESQNFLGSVIVRKADRAELVAVLFAGPAPAAGGGA